MRILSLSLALSSLLAAQVPQAPNPTQQSSPAQPSGQTPVYRVTVVARTTKAINYHHRSGSTKIDFRGTAPRCRAPITSQIPAKLRSSIQTAILK